MVACCPEFVALSSPTSACKVATTDGITHENVQRNPPGTLPPLTVTTNVLRGSLSAAIVLILSRSWVLRG